MTEPHEFSSSCECIDCLDYCAEKYDNSEEVNVLEELWQ